MGERRLRTVKEVSPGSAQKSPRTKGSGVHVLEASATSHVPVHGSPSCRSYFQKPTTQFHLDLAKVLPLHQNTFESTKKTNERIKKSRNQPIQSFFAHLVLIYVMFNLAVQARSVALTFHMQLVIQARPAPSSWPTATPCRSIQDHPNSLPLAPCFGLSCCQPVLLSASSVAALETK